MIDYIVSIFTEGAIFAIMALGLNIVWGWSGDFDLAFYGYVALGVYMTLVLTVGPAQSPTEYILGLSLPFPVAVILAMVSSMLLALVVGSIALRHLRGIYFSIVTLGAVYVLYIFAGQFVPLFNGYNGVSGLFNPMSDVLGLDFTSYPYFYLGLCLVVLAVVVLVVTRLSDSRFGLALRSLREDERAAAAFGRDIYRTKLKAYVLGAALGGLGGGLFAGYLSAFNISAWSPTETITLYAAILIGGRGSTRGVLVGILVMYMGLQEATRYLPEVAGHASYAAAFRVIITGVALVLFIRFRPQGLLPERRMRDGETGGRGDATVAAEPAVTAPAFGSGAT
ncbi:MAG TPA: branched-chain amino acid ABC transporter permease [Candidatus Dormibacteraeota bacterium]|nr:branched-chain amino acid ABC transporter permease [Candidatus Dormibacteraeota bacterium]